MRIVAAIQARLGSQRYPRKIMKNLLGKPMLYHIVERVKRTRDLDDVVVICPMRDFAEISRIVSCKTFANSDVDENNLVERYWKTAAAFGADVVVRVCADNPCVDPENINQLLSLFKSLAGACKSERELLDKYLLSNVGDFNETKWPQGLGAEVYSRDLLFGMHESIQGAKYLEHPHKYFHYLEQVIEPGFPLDLYSDIKKIRFDVNTQEDFNKIAGIYGKFGNNDFLMKDLLEQAYGHENRDSEHLSARQRLI